MLRRRLTLILLSAAFAALFLFPTFSALLTDWWWFGEIGYRILVGGGLGRTPMIGKVIREFLPRGELLAWLKSHGM